MTRFLDYINEARKNPEQNTKVGLVQALSPYKNIANMFIQFSDIDKLGVNPQTEYNTPGGIYSYPLKQIWSLLIKNKIPFASDRKYVILFKASNYITSSYNKLESDISKLRKIYGLIDNEVRLGKLNATNKTPLGQLWNITRMIAVKGTGQSVSNSIWQWNKVFRNLGYNGVADLKGEGIIHENEPTQAVFFSKQGLNVIDIIPNKRYDTNIDYKGVFEPFLKHIEQKENWNSKNILKTIDYVYSYRKNFNDIDYSSLSKQYQEKIYRILRNPNSFAFEYSDALTVNIIKKLDKYYYSLLNTNNKSYISDFIKRLKLIFYKILKSRSTAIYKNYINKHFDKYKEIIKDRIAKGASMHSILDTLEQQIKYDAPDIFDAQVDFDIDILLKYIIELYKKEVKGNV